MTLAELQLDVYRRLDYADIPPPSVTTRIQNFLNTQYVRLLSTDRMRPLREASIPLYSVNNQSVYALTGTTVARVQRVTDLTNRYELLTKPLEWYRRVNPGGYITGTPEVWVPTTTGYRTYTLTLHPTPSAALEYSIDIERPVLPLEDPTDVPDLLPEDFHDLLSLLARCDEYEFKSDDRWAGAKLQADRRVMELRAWVDNHDPYKRTALPDYYPMVARDGSREPLVGPGVPPSSGGGSGPHTILSAEHTDTVPGVLVPGDLLLVTNSGLLTRLPLGAPGQVLKVQLGTAAWVDPAPPGVGTGDVLGPASSEVQQVAVYADDTGKVIKPSGAWISDIGDVSLNNRIHFSGLPSTAPALVRNASALEARLVDDSALVEFSAKALREHGRAVPMGEFIAVPYNAADFTGYGSMLWNVEDTDFIYAAYTLIGKTMFLSFQINTSSIAGTPSTLLYMKIPGGFVASHTILGTACYVRNGASAALLNGYLVASAGFDKLGIAKVEETAFVLSNHTTYVYANAVIPVVVP